MATLSNAVRSAACEISLQASRTSSGTLDRAVGAHALVALDHARIQHLRLDDRRAKISGRACVPISS